MLLVGLEFTAIRCGIGVGGLGVLFDCCVGVWCLVVCCCLGVGASGYYGLISWHVVVLLILLARVWWVYDCVVHRLFDMVLFV